MRPDEHKKKKNAAYKKKHGISKETDKDEKEKSHCRDQKINKKKDLTPKSGANAATPKSHPDIAGINNSDNDQSSDSEGELLQTKTKQKNFQRRQIVSNWTKYELGPELPEDDPKGGKDYKELLSLAGEAMSHFRFSDELEWDVQDKDATSTAEEASVLSLDISEIGQSLQCLPIHTVLRISEDLFPEEQLACSVKRASEKLAASYKCKDFKHLAKEQRQTSSLKDLDIFSSLPDSGEVHGFSNIHKPVSIINSALSNSLKKKEVNSDEHVTSDSVGQFNVYKQQDNSSLAHTERIVSNVVQSFPKDKSKSKQNETISELDLDSLLDMDSPNSNVQYSNTSTEASKVNLESKASKIVECQPDKCGIEMDLDSLLELDPPSNNTVNSSTEFSPQAKLEDKKTNKSADNSELEDWLDTLLD